MSHCILVIVCPSHVLPPLLPALFLPPRNVHPAWQSCMSLSFHLSDRPNLTYRFLHRPDSFYTALPPNASVPHKVSPFCPSCNAISNSVAVTPRGLCEYPIRIPINRRLLASFPPSFYSLIVGSRRFTTEVVTSQRGLISPNSLIPKACQTPEKWTRPGWFPYPSYPSLVPHFNVFPQNPRR